MDMNNVNIEEIVKQVLSGMTGTAPAAAQTAAPAAPAQSTASGSDDQPWILTKQKVLKEINQFRAKDGYAPVTLDNTFQAQAEGIVSWMEKGDAGQVSRAEAESQESALREQVYNSVPSCVIMTQTYDSGDANYTRISVGIVNAEYTYVCVIYY